MISAASPASFVHSTSASKLGRWAFFSLLAGAIPMAVAGDVRSVYLWAFAAGCSAVALYAVHTISPELARERYHPPSPGLDGTMLRSVRLITLATVVFALNRIGMKLPAWPALLLPVAAALVIRIFFQGYPAREPLSSSLQRIYDQTHLG